MTKLIRIQGGNPTQGGRTLDDVAGDMLKLIQKHAQTSPPADGMGDSEKSAIGEIVDLGRPVVGIWDGERLVNENVGESWKNLPALSIDSKTAKSGEPITVLFTRRGVQPVNPDEIMQAIKYGIKTLMAVGDNGLGGYFANAVVLPADIKSFRSQSEIKGLLQNGWLRGQRAYRAAIARGEIAYSARDAAIEEFSKALDKAGFETSYEEWQ